VSDAEFRIGRVAFLRRMLAAPHVYLTVDAQHRGDETARANMSWELEALRFKK